MARKRMISPEIWQSEDFAKLPMLSKLLFIGIFSHADDAGRGRAKANYLKSVVFPYENELSVSEVDGALDEIASHMSVTFYKTGGGEYYELTNWRVWQKVEKPQESKLPPPEGCERIRTGEAKAPGRRARTKRRAVSDVPAEKTAQKEPVGPSGKNGTESEPMAADSERFEHQSGCSQDISGAKWGEVGKSECTRERKSVGEQSESHRGAIGERSGNGWGSIGEPSGSGRGTVEPNRTEKKENKNGTECNGMSGPVTGNRIAITLPLSDRTSYGITDIQIARWTELYPAIDVMAELRKMAGWLEASPQKRKTGQGIPRFIANWLARAQDEKSAPLRKPADWYRGNSNPALRYPQRDMAGHEDDGVDWL